MGVAIRTGATTPCTFIITSHDWCEEHFPKNISNVYYTEVIALILSWERQVLRGRKKKQGVSDDQR